MKRHPRLTREMVDVAMVAHQNFELTPMAYCPVQVRFEW